MILHPARANRLIEHHARNSSLPSLESVVDRLINSTVKAAPKSGMEGAIQMATNYALFTNMAKLAMSKTASAETKAIMFLKLDQLKVWLQLKATIDEEWKAHYRFIAKQIDSLQSDPAEFKSEELLPAPPGMPIGSSEEQFCSHN
jgi:hypothetical protein